MKDKMKRSILLWAGLLLLPGLGRAASVTLDWTANSESDLAGYRLYHSTNTSLQSMTTAQAFASAAVTKTVITAPTVTRALTGLLDGASYYFRLTAFDNAPAPNESGFNVDGAGNPIVITTFTVMPAPTGLSGSAPDADTVNLTWTSNANNETQFIIERSLNGSTGFASVGTAAANATSFSDNSVSGGTSYFYRVRAANALTTSAPSNVLNVTTPAAVDTTPPAAPRGLTLR